MSADKETLAVYQSRAGDYAKMVDTDAPFPALEAFIAAIPNGGHVLDLGCGPGRASATMQAAGLVIDAVDASAAMVEQAKTLQKINARIATFDDISGESVYDGVWANFSLLHAPKSAFPHHLEALHKSLRPGGIFHLGLKTGEGEIRDGIGRFYALYTLQELETILTNAGFQISHHATGEDLGLDGTSAPWIMITAYA